MIQSSAAYKDAIVGSPRRTEVQVMVDLTDPEMVWQGVSASDSAPWGGPEQAIDKELDPPKRYGTLEVDRMIQDGTVSLFPKGFQVPESLGWTGALLCDGDGVFQYPPWIRIDFANVATTQAVMVLFSSDPLDGVAQDFTVEIWVRGALFRTVPVTENQDVRVYIKGALYEPTAIRLTMTKWSLPYRRPRVVELSPGVMEKWNNNDLASFQCTQQAEFSCLSLPYGSVDLSMDNQDRRFDPRDPDSLFATIREKQHVDVSIGVKLPDGTYERKRVGRYYMSGDGWKDSDNDITMGWYLVDIIGLLTDRPFTVTATKTAELPATLGGWLSAITGQLGESFKNWWSADPAYVNKPVTALFLEDVTGKTCGEMIRWVCQATGTWPRADAETGKLCAEPLWNSGGTVKLDNLETYPRMSANKTLSKLMYTLINQHQETDEETGEPAVDPDTGEPVMVRDTEEYTIDFPANPTGLSVPIRNPFFHTKAQADEATRLIVTMYGGNFLETTGRGDPSSEIGDVDTVWLDKSHATSARRMSQTFQIQDGVLRSCRSKLLQATGAQMLENSVLITASGYWTPPPGVTSVTLILGGGGQGGKDGENGMNSKLGEGNVQPGNVIPAAYGADGQNGSGGSIWSGNASVTPGVPIYIHIGAGGPVGGMGGATTFGTFSSADGHIYPNGYTDIAELKTYGRTGVQAPIAGSGDGGAGGAGGTPGTGYWEIVPRVFSSGHVSSVFFRAIWHPGDPPGPGQPGTPGASGFALIRWSK